MPGRVGITRRRIDVAAVERAARRPTAGAVVVFVGTTRNQNVGRRVRRLEYEAFAAMAVKEMRVLAARATRKWRLAGVSMAHRIGVVPVGDASVVIAASADHRAEAFAACRWLIDRLKEVVPIWKKEHFDGGEVWIGSQRGDAFPPGAVAPRGKTPR